MAGLGDDLATLPLGAWARKPYKETGSWVLVRPARKVPAGPADFDEVRRQAVEDMKTAKKQELVTRRAAEVRAELAAGAPLDSVAAKHGGLKDSGLLTRSAASCRSSATSRACSTAH